MKFSSINLLIISVVCLVSGCKKANFYSGSNAVHRAPVDQSIEPLRPLPVQPRITPLSSHLPRIPSYPNLYTYPSRTIASEYQPDVLFPQSSTPEPMYPTGPSAEPSQTKPDLVRPEPSTPDTTPPNPNQNLLKPGEKEIWCYASSSSTKSLRGCDWFHECQVKFAQTCKSGRATFKLGANLAGQPRLDPEFGYCKTVQRPKSLYYTTPCGESKKGGIRIWSARCQCE
jgi:hypothetical protein